MKKSVLRAALAAPVATAGLYLLAVRGRRGHPAWEKLARFRYAHRGLHDRERGVPENSLAAFRAAVEKGFGAELDVHLTRDGRLAVIHDDSLLRTAGVDVKVSELTAEELGQYRLEGTQEKIPLLEEVLPLFEGKTPLIVELKVENNAAALARAACELLDRYRVDYCIESFHPQALWWLRKNRPDVCRGQLSDNFLKDRAGLSWPAAFAMTHLLTSPVTCPDFVAYRWQDRKRLSLKLARRVWGVREVSWTVQDPETMAACERDGCLTIFERFVPGQAEAGGQTVKREKSCGAVIYRLEGGERRYLILHSAQGHHTLCKGHVEGAETERETAVREIFEETGLTVRFTGGFRQVITYAPRPGRIKDVVFFLAQAEPGALACQPEEVADAEFLPFEGAMARLTHPSDRDVLAGAERFLNGIEENAGREPL